MKSPLFLLWILIFSVGFVVSLYTCSQEQKRRDKGSNCLASDDGCIECYKACKELNGIKLRYKYEQVTFGADVEECWCKIENEPKRIY